MHDFQVQLLEHDLNNSQRRCEQLVTELNELSSQLQCRENERQRMGEELELWKAQVHSLMSEKKELEVIGCDDASLFYIC